VIGYKVVKFVPGHHWPTSVSATDEWVDLRLGAMCKAGGNSVYFGGSLANITLTYTSADGKDVSVSPAGAKIKVEKENPEPHVPPMADCSCGIYIAGELRPALRYFPAVDEDDDGVYLPKQGDAYGLVLVSGGGKFVQHETGYRVQEAVITHFITPHPEWGFESTIGLMEAEQMVAGAYGRKPTDIMSCGLTRVPWLASVVPQLVDFRGRGKRVASGV